VGKLKYEMHMDLLSGDHALAWVSELGRPRHKPRHHPGHQAVPLVSLVAPLPVQWAEPLARSATRDHSAKPVLRWKLAAQDQACQRRAGAAQLRLAERGLAELPQAGLEVQAVMSGPLRRRKCPSPLVRPMRRQKAALGLQGWACLAVRPNQLSGARSPHIWSSIFQRPPIHLFLIGSGVGDDHVQVVSRDGGMVGIRGHGTAAQACELARDNFPCSSRVETAVYLKISFKSTTIFSWSLHVYSTHRCASLKLPAHPGYCR